MKAPFMPFTPIPPLFAPCIPRAAASVGLNEAVGFMADIMGINPIVASFYGGTGLLIVISVALV